MKWKMAKFGHSVTNRIRRAHRFPENTRSPLSYFYDFFNDDTIDLIVYQTNLYFMQSKGSELNLDRETVKGFIGVLLLMGIIKLPAVTDYWSKRFRVDKIANVMSYRKFVRIKRYIHFADNDLKDDDPYYKIRPVFEKVRQNCLNTAPEYSYSIDEMMVPYKGDKAGSNKQYMPKKPNKWGFKMFVRSGVSGVAYDFYLYSGATTFDTVDFSKIEETHPFSSQCVLALCKSIKEPAMNTVFFDNFFSNPELMIHLRREYGILSVGTIRRNRTRGACITSENEMKKKERGTTEECCDNEKKIAIVQWMDTKPVVLASTYVSAEPMETIKRWSRAERSYIDVPCPSIIKEYNQHMGGVDLSDMLIALYRTPLRSHRWYLVLFGQLLDICIMNAWLTYRRDMEAKKEQEEINTGNKRKKQSEDSQELVTVLAKSTQNRKNNKKGKRGQAMQKQTNKEVQEETVGELAIENEVMQDGAAVGEKILHNEQSVQVEGQIMEGAGDTSKEGSAQKKKFGGKKRKMKDEKLTILPLKNFRAEVAEQLIRYSNGKKKMNNPRTVTPEKSLEVLPQDHLPVCSTKGRCRFCKENKTIMMCQACGKRFCIVPNRNCFLAYHSFTY